MQRNRLLAIVVPASLLLGLAGLGSSTLTACGNSGGSGTGGTSTAGDCFDYSSFDGTTPAVAFKADVLPIFRQSCGISTSCHGCDTSSDPGCSTSGFTPFLGTSMADADPTAAQIQAIFDQAVGKAAILQPALSDGSMVGEPDMKIVAAGDPDHSFLMYKLDGDPTAATAQVTCSTLTCASGMICGAAMPSGGPQLPTASRDTIRRWIAQGAKND